MQFIDYGLKSDSLERLQFYLQLPIFIRLCEDEIWGIRKACAQVLPQMALLVSLESRRKYLVPAMKKFIFDDSEWVIITALRVSYKIKMKILK